MHELSRILVRIFYAVPPLWKFRVTGREYIDRRKPYVIVVNHQAGLDIPTLYFVPLNFRWVSKREVFKVPFFGQFLLLHGDICINRGHATAAMEKVIRDGKLWLSRGASVAIFPEGTRSHDGEIYRFKAGAFTLAREAGVEILPVVLDGTTTMIGRNGMFNWSLELSGYWNPVKTASLSMNFHAVQLGGRYWFYESFVGHFLGHLEIGRAHV